MRMATVSRRLTKKRLTKKPARGQPTRGELTIQVPNGVQVFVQYFDTGSGPLAIGECVSVEPVLLPPPPPVTGTPAAPRTMAMRHGPIDEFRWNAAGCRGTPNAIC